MLGPAVKPVAELGAVRLKRFLGREAAADLDIYRAVCGCVPGLQRHMCFDCVTIRKIRLYFI